jgi:sterol desaturase/sphingolipid hydroxylase (fatty acid hydroxylase superfamily)
MLKQLRALPKAMPGWLNATLICGTFATLLWLEHRRPLRRQTERKLTRNIRNLVLAACSAAAIRLTERPVTDPLTQFVERNRWGLVNLLQLPLWLEVALSVLLLDYTLYLWHVLTHKVPVLWRFHRVHHADLDLDASTALRFHCIEMILSVPWRTAQVLAIGVAPLTLSIWQTATLLAILFHHSNVKIPLYMERWLCRFIVTPRMHGIHHSMVHEETDANWSTIFAFPDYLHRTRKLNVPQQAVTIGVPAYRDPQELTLAKIMAMPFGKQRPTWQLPGDGSPERGLLLGAPDALTE